MSLNVVKPTGALVSPNGQPLRSYALWFSLVSDLVRALVTSGTTANRPTTFLWAGRPYFDTTLGKPIWYSGSGWVDATGAGA